MPWGADSDGNRGDGNRLADRVRATRRRLLAAVAAAGGTAGVVGGAAGAGGGTDGASATREPAQASGVGPTLVEAAPDAGFEHPYYLYAPSGIDRSPVSMLVEPVNSGTPSDDFQQDLDRGRRMVRGGKARRIADELGVPLVVPLFPNPRSGEHGDAFTQYLDVETMRIESGALARIDRQTLATADHAADRLADNGITADPEALALNGFSASGNFVNKLAALHPERVTSLTAGAVNGTAILPLERAKGHRLPYQIGIANLESFTGEPFDPAAWREVDQLLYMGEAERPPTDDTLPYRGVWSAEQASVAYDVYGRDMQEDRMPYCERVYDEAGATARFEVYDDTGHSYSSAILSDVIAFHRASLGVTDLRVPGTPQIGSREVTVEAFVTSDAGESVSLRVVSENGTQLAAEPVTIPTDTPTETTVRLTRGLRSGEEVTVLALPADTDDPGAAVARETAVATARLAVTDRVVDGDTSIRVSYALAETADDTAILSVVPNGAGPYYERRLQLARVSPGENGTATFSLSAEETGVPFAAGERVQVWLIPNGNQVPDRAVVTSETTVDDPPGSAAFTAAPDDGAEQVAVRYGLADWYEGDATLQLVTDAGTATLASAVSPGTATSESVAVPSELAPLGRGDRVALRLVAGDTTLAEAETIVDRDALASLSTQPVFGGGTAITVTYEVAAAVDGGATLDVRDDTGASVADAVSVSAGESGEASVSLADPVTVGDELTVRLTGSGSALASETRRVRRIESADVSFDGLPAADETSIETTVRLGDDFPDDRGRLRLFPDEGGGRYGIGVDFLDRGTETTNTYELSQRLGRFGLGTGIELRLYPADWSYVDDVVALDRSTISGVRLPGPVRPGDESVDVAYAVPEAVAEEARLRITVGGVEVTSEPVDPGGAGERTVTLDPRPGAGEAFVAEITNGERAIVSTSQTVTPRRASVAFENAPAARDTTVTASVALDAGYDAERPVDLRLYTEGGSGFGTRLASVTPGEERRETFELDPREGEVPFAPAETIRLAVVDGDDPYATAPLATAAVTAGGSVSDGADTPTATEQPTATATPAESASSTATESPTATAGPADGTASTETTALGDASASDTTATTGALGDWVPGAALAGVAGYLLRRVRDDESVE